MQIQATVETYAQPGSQFIFNRKGNVCTIGGHKKLGQTSNLYKVKKQTYTSCKFGFLQIRL
jgi:hypothetical protein